jgi:hypothetical protein
VTNVIPPETELEWISGQYQYELMRDWPRDHLSRTDQARYFDEVARVYDWLTKTGGGFHDVKTCEFMATHARKRATDLRTPGPGATRVRHPAGRGKAAPATE